MKSIKIVLVILILILSITIIFPVISNAADYQVNPGDYKPDELQEEDVEGFEAFGSRIAGVVQVVGTMVSVGAIMIIGIKYVITSADEKAELKEKLIPDFIGAVLLFGATIIVNVLYKIFFRLI